MSGGEMGDRDRDRGPIEERAGTTVPDAFVRENREYVRSLAEALLTLDGGTLDSEGVDGAFRAAHSLKANCQAAGLDGAAALAHAVEDLLEARRAGRLPADRIDADEALDAVEEIGAAIDRARSGCGGIDPGDRVERLRAALDDGGATGNGNEPPGSRAADRAGDGGSTTAEGSTTEGPAADDDLDPEVRAALRAASDYDDLDALVAEMDDDAGEFGDLEGGGSFDGIDGTDGDGASDTDDASAPPGEGTDRTGPETGTEPTGAAPATGSGAAAASEGSAVSEASESGSESPGITSAFDPAPRTAALPGTVPAGGLLDGTPDDSSDRVRVPGAGPAVDAAPTIAASSLDEERFGIEAVGDHRDEGSGTVATALEPVRDLTAVRSLTVARRRLAAALAERGVDDPRVRDALASLRGATDGLGDAAARDGLARVDRLVPDLERAAAVATRGTDTEVRLRRETAPVAVPTPVVDRLADPLCHLVRNAVDHGIEPPGERGAAGKPREGRVTLRARRDGGDLVVSVADDGRGIDPDAVREAAVEAGVVDDPGSLSAEATREVLFEAGLSTATGASEVSGRGVGMDVVADAAADLDGSVTVDSTPGEGTTVRLRVPVPLAVVGVTFVAVGHEGYGVPAAAVRAVVPAADATDLGDGRIRLPVPADGGTDGALGATEVCRAVDLAAALSVPEGTPDPRKTGRSAGDPAGSTTGPEAPENGPVYLLIEPGSGREDPPAEGTMPLALRCGGVLDEWETMVTPLEGAVGGLSGLDGVAVRDAGRVVVLLDPEGLADRC